MEGYLDWLLSHWFWFALALVINYVIDGFTVVDQWERVPVLRFGRYVRTLGPGISWIEPFSHKRMDEVSIADEVANIKMFSQTKDNVPIRFVSVVTYAIHEERIESYTIAVFDAEDSITRRIIAAVSERVRRTELDHLQHDPNLVSLELVETLNSRLGGWGVEIKAVEISSISIKDKAIQEAISPRARAQREAEAEQTRADAQFRITEALNVAAENLTPAGFELKRLETMLELTRSAQNNTILVPSDALAGLSGLGKPMYLAQDSTPAPGPKQNR